jgi:hypothetical protein
VKAACRRALKVVLNFARVIGLVRAASFVPTLGQKVVPKAARKPAKGIALDPAQRQVNVPPLNVKNANAPSAALLKSAAKWSDVKSNAAKATLRVVKLSPRRMASRK